MGWGDDLRGSGRFSSAMRVGEALEESEARFRTLFDQSPLGVFTFDRQLRITDCNRAFVEVIRSDYDKLVGLDLRLLRDPTLVPAFENVLNGEPYFYAGPYETTTSDVKIEITLRLSPLRDAHGEVTGGLGIVESASERRTSEELLRKNEARFRVLIDQAPDPIGVFRDGRRIYANQRLAAYLGYTNEELVGGRVVDVFHPDDRPIHEDRNRRRAAGEQLAPQEYRLIRKDGTMVFAEISSIQIELDGAPAVACILRDTTERRQLQAQLMKADRMASMGTLAAGIAHEINNPLSYVMTNLEVLSTYRMPELVRAGTTPELRELAAKIGEAVSNAREGVERVRRIVRDVKLFSRAEADGATLVDVKEVLDAALHLVGADIEHRARLVKDYQDVPRVLASESRLGQVLVNLLVNAVQALGPEKKDHEIHVTLRTPRPDAVTIEIRDTGQGMTPQVLARAFEPFFTTKPKGVGTGLGLFVCQSIVAEIGGEITAESEVGRGTTIRLTLPVRAYEGPVARDASVKPAPRKARVLLIDDEVALGRALAIALAPEHEVVLAHNGQEALAILKRDQAFDVVLCDLMMPGVTGMDVWEEVRRTQPAIAERFVFVTGGAFTPRARAFLEGDGGKPRHTLDKPFDVAKLRAVLDERIRASGAKPV